MKILVIRLSSLGDVVLTGPVFLALRKAYPDAVIVSLVKEEFAGVLAANASINEHWVLRREEPLKSLIRRVREARFDVLIDLHGNIRSRLLSFFSGAPRRVCYRKAALARRLYVDWRIPSALLEQHTLDRYLEALRQLDPSQPAFQPLAASGPLQFLIIQTAYLGDAVLTTPLLAALHERYPDSSITVLCTPEIAEVFHRHPAVNELILFDKRGKDHSLLKRWQVVKQLSQRRFDIAVLPHRSLTSALLARLSGIPRRIGFSSSQGRWFLTDVVPFQWGVHDVDRNLALLKPLGVQQPVAELWIQPEPEAVKSVAERLRQAGVGPEVPLLGINAGSLWATKRWLPERFAAVADQVIQDLKAKIVFVGGPKDREVMNEVLRFMKQVPIDWVGKTDLRELIATISRCSAFLTNDSGPMHIAVASRVPTVALFGPTTRELGFFPYGPGNTVIEKDLPCRPCGLHGAERCPLDHFECMRRITVEEVVSALRPVLKSTDSITVSRL
ncbi:MAG: lipopolysaccharide heptosyltransferase II [Elusimicrobiota bacterium]|jgi:heptosyltransferase-2